MKNIIFAVTMIVFVNISSYLIPYMLTKPEFTHDPQLHFISLALMASSNILAIPYIVMFYLLLHFKTKK